MNDNPEREEPIYIGDQQPPEQHITPDVAQDPDELAQKQRPQVPEGQEIEPSKTYSIEIVGKDRHATIGSVSQGPKQLQVQTQKRPDLMSFQNEASDQMSVTSTEAAIQQARENDKVLVPSDYPQITVQEFMETDAANIEKTYPQLRKGRLNRTHIPASKAGDSARIVKKK